MSSDCVLQSRPPIVSSNRVLQSCPPMCARAAGGRRAARRRLDAARHARRRLRRRARRAVRPVCRVCARSGGRRADAAAARRARSGRREPRPSAVVLRLNALRAAALSAWPPAMQAPHAATRSRCSQVPLALPRDARVADSQRAQRRQLCGPAGRIRTVDARARPRGAG
eukprot:6224103-Prymnesium_polylepis.1